MFIYVHKVARETNEELRSIHVEPSDGFDVGAILSVAKRFVFFPMSLFLVLPNAINVYLILGASTRQLSSDHEATRIEALNWISALLNKHRAEVKRPVFVWHHSFTKLKW